MWSDAPNGNIARLLAFAAVDPLVSMLLASNRKFFC
jgi:hypothetical protein